MDSSFFVFTHETTVFDSISTEDSGEFTFKTFLNHGITPNCYGFKQSEKWDKCYSEEREMRSEIRIALTDEKSLQVRCSRNSTFIGFSIQY
jgi:hypothetical protein